MSSIRKACLCRDAARDQIHAVVLLPEGAQIARSAGNAVQLINVDGENATLKLLREIRS
jgi:ribosomal protein L2